MTFLFRFADGGLSFARIVAIFRQYILLVVLYLLLQFRFDSLKIEGCVIVFVIFEEFSLQSLTMDSFLLGSIWNFYSMFVSPCSFCIYNIDCIAQNLKIICLFFRWLLVLKIKISVSVVSMRYFVSKFNSLFPICSYNFDWISWGLKVVLLFLCFSGKSFTSITHRDFSFTRIFTKFCQYVCLVGLYQQLYLQRDCFKEKGFTSGFRVFCSV